ncbi:hypothetical protein F4777DRAFT_182897 [Nemania sp. FL0916]|nr:hypothetical protein F4777DRAFT_182897 [Nemania sp. FL0916]
MEAKARAIKSLRSLTLDLPPSCIEFCPAHPDHLVIGTYNLQTEEPATEEGNENSDNEANYKKPKKPQSRNGSLVVFRLAATADDISHVQTLSYPSALLDLHFHPHQDKHEVLATVSSTGTLSFFRLSPPRSPSAPLVELATCKPLGDDDESVLFLSCAWHPSLPHLLAVTTSNYQVHILRVDDAWDAHQVSFSPVITHELEAWTVVFSPIPGKSHDVVTDTAAGGSHEFVIFSGGDDSKLLTTTCFYDEDGDTGAEDDKESVTTPFPTVGIKGHMAGVTAILPLSFTLSDGARIVVTGSYDDHIRVYSIHPQVGGVMIRPPKLISEENLGGGVWRLKLIKLNEPSEEDDPSQAGWSALILASCMHAGSRIVEINGDYGDSCQINVLGRFEEHKSMNYGSDFQPGTELDDRTLHCVSTSFYDRLICLWRF